MVGYVLQSNEYYPFGLQTANSWTRENNTNNFLYNEGSELNTNTNWYDLPYRNYDPTLGRFTQIDPLASSDHTLTPYHYAGNDPISSNDPSGLARRQQNNGGFGDWTEDDNEARRQDASSGGGSGGIWSWSMTVPSIFSSSRYGVSGSSPRIWSPWGGSYQYTDSEGRMHYAGEWLDLYSFEGMRLAANKLGVDSKVEVDWGLSFTDGFANGFMFNSIKASLWREFYTDNVGRLQGLPDRVGRDLRSSYLSRVRANTPQPMLSWAQDMKANGASVRPGARFWITNQNVNISMRGLGMGSAIGLAMTTVPRVYNSYQSEGLVGVANETSTIMGGIMGAATAMELVAPYALATANPWTAGIIFIGAGIVGGFAGEEAVRGVLSIIK